MGQRGAGADREVMPDEMPEALEEISRDFLELGPKDRLQLLLEFSDELPDLPPRYADAPEKLEQVHECQSPLFLVVEVASDPGVDAGDQRVSIFFSAPRRRRRREVSPGSCMRGSTG